MGNLVLDWIWTYSSEELVIICLTTRSQKLNQFKDLINLMNLEEFILPIISMKKIDANYSLMNVPRALYVLYSIISHLLSFSFMVIFGCMFILCWSIKTFMAMHEVLMVSCSDHSVCCCVSSIVISNGISSGITWSISVMLHRNDSYMALY